MLFSEAIKRKWKLMTFPDGLWIVTDDADEELVLGDAVGHTREFAKYICELHNWKVDPGLFPGQ